VRRRYWPEYSQVLRTCEVFTLLEALGKRPPAGVKAFAARPDECRHSVRIFSREFEKCGLAGREMLSASASAKLIGVSREAVRRKHQRYEVLGLKGAKRGLRFPKWQVTPNSGLLPELPKLFDMLGGEFLDCLSVSHSTQIPPFGICPLGRNRCFE